MDNVIHYGDGKQIRYGIQQFFTLDYFEIDAIIDEEFPALHWSDKRGGIIAVTECTNDSVLEYPDIGNPRWRSTQRQADGILAGDFPDWVSIYAILEALVKRGVIPKGNYLIRVSW